MSNLKKNEKLIKTAFSKWFPIIFTLLIIYLFPPVAIAVIAAFFTAPLLQAVHAVTRLPLTLSTLFVISSIFLVTGSFFYIGLHGMIEIFPVVENHLASLQLDTDILGQGLAFLEEKVVEYGQAVLDYAITMIQMLFQQLMSLFIFLVAYFFALRESGKERFWFLIYFPVRFRKQAKHTLSKASKLIGTFIFVEARLIFITFIILSIGFALLRFTSPIGIALLISLADSLPFLGIGIFLIPMIVFFFYSGDLFIGTALVLLYLVTITTRQFAESYMWASTFQLKPIHAFFILACAVYTFGLAGILLSPFLLFAALKIKQHPLFNE
ncbi:AI-2E family transporter [Sporosarcina pasteurii]|uniref:Sporulation integral membrane protein YtvI n=1 Tax=Sporosarcina pasteurii TaxID=1474 RepID=A0A380C4Y3_SPOPA|nr:AI-2E family transporter [Sporosarcina pasteurii]MDS9471735.1 AI-2E family transporter [Sporosarcina pasteurii]QBQ04666.1 AI-2E family transporter [Sporosarcina pasteurii]SUJ12873.1 sporulation integral membrane protein YtvI [Sporosarcina pasteurii]